MTSIDPTTCKPGEYYLVRRFAHTAPATRVNYSATDSEKSDFRWVIAGLNGNCIDGDITVLHRLVPEPEEKTLDVPMQPWDILREAESIARHLDGIERSSILAHANHLEREHRATQEKAEEDAAREALIVKAAKALAFAGERNDSGVSSDELWSNYLTPSTRERYLAQARALADAGLLAEAVQP